ncbi:MAG: phosphatidate cytidylyltransferase [Bacteroidales bacterium]
MNNFFRRTLTGAYIVIFVLGGYWLHPVSFFLAGLIMLSGSMYEYYRIIGNSGVRPLMIPGLVTGITGYVLSTLAAAGEIQLKFLLLILPMLAIMMITELYRKQEKPFDSISHTFFPLIYSVIPFSLFPFSAYNHIGLATLIPHGNIVFSPGIIVGFFLLIWANDTGAYLIGITLGKHRLFERISPKKSWEGFIGGVILAAIVSWLLSGWLGVVSPVKWLIISLIISIIGTYGDLVESMLKRSTGIKDSGNIMPGHGGFLDRFDSTVMSFPIVFLFISFFG